MKRTTTSALMVVLSVFFLSVSAAFAAGDIRTERVHFKKGASSAVVESSIKGYATVDYVLGAKKGQYMNVSMATDNGANYFNIMAPGEKDVAFFVGSTSGNQYEGVPPASEDYKIRVYMMRSAARRNEVAKYRLEMIITNAEATSAAPKVASASSEGDGQPTGSCAFGVVREGGGSGIVTVTKADGRTRAIYFEKGKATGCDASQADPGEFSAKREGDLNIVHFGKERYEIPDAVIFGG